MMHRKASVVRHHEVLRIARVIPPLFVKSVGGEEMAHCSTLSIVERKRKMRLVQLRERKGSSTFDFAVLTEPCIRPQLWAV